MKRKVFDIYLIILIPFLMASCSNGSVEFVLVDEKTGLGYIPPILAEDDTSWGYYVPNLSSHIIWEGSENFDRLQQGLPLIDYSASSKIGTNTLNGMVVYSYNNFGDQTHVTLHELGHRDITQQNISMGMSKDSLEVNEQFTIYLFGDKGSGLIKAVYNHPESGTKLNFRDIGDGAFELNSQFESKGVKVATVSFYAHQTLLLQKELHFYVKAKTD